MEKVKLLVRRLYFRVFVINLSLKWIRSNNIGDRVRHKSKVWILNQGVRSPIWKMYRYSSQGYLECEALEQDFKKLMSFNDMLQSFKSGYRFYMGYWFEIWVQKGIEPWMRNCNIRLNNKEGVE